LVSKIGATSLLSLLGSVVLSTSGHAAACSADTAVAILPASPTVPAASIYQIGSAPQFTVETAGAITVSAIDYWGRSVAAGASIRSSASSWTITLPVQRTTGYFELRVATSAGGPTGCTSWAVVPSGAPDGRFGINTQVGFGNPPGVERFVRAANIGAVRDSLAWNEVVTSANGAANFPAVYDSYMAALAQDHVAPLLTLAFGNPLFEPAGAGAWTLPYGAKVGVGTDITAFAQYAGDLGRRYGALEAGRLSVAVWNEVDGTFCQGPACASGDARAAAYAALVKATAAATHAAGGVPVPIVGGATYGIPLPWFESLLDAGVEGACPVTVPASTPTTNAIAASIQSLDIHWYGRPEDLANNLIDLETLATRCVGAAKPIVATEFGTSDWRDAADDYAVANAQNANGLVKQAAVMLSYGVSAMYWYVLNDRTIDVAGDPENILRTNDGGNHYAPNPAYPAYANFIANLKLMTAALDGDKVPVGNISPDDRTRIYPFTDPSGSRRLYIAWAVPEFLNADIRGLNAAPVKFVAPMRTTITDVMGNLLGTYRAGSTVSLSLTASPVYISVEGGWVPRFSTTAPALLASSFDDFGLTYPASGRAAPEQPSGNWSYGEITAPSGDASAVVPGIQARFVPTKTWLDGYWGDPAKYYFSVSAAGQEPVVVWSGNTPSSMWAVRRWTCPSAGPACRVAISGQAALASTQGAGTRLLIIANDTVQYEGDLIPNGNVQPAASIETAAGTGTAIAVTVAPGEPIDFAVTTGPKSNGTLSDEFDYTGLYVWITAD